MNCPDCGKPSDVIDTRPTPWGSLRRRRRCFNDHVFTTTEIAGKPSDLHGAIAAVRSAWARLQKTPQ